ncbi:MAG: peptidase associated/transthyretin-like domain-containing protein, partial [Planctomycetota bacterium]
PPPEREVIVVLEAPEGSGLRHERPAILRVVDATTGAGVADAEVTGPGATERTDADGFCELPRDGGKPRAWTVTAEGYAPEVAGGIGAGATVGVVPGRPLAIVVRDTFDRPVPGARIALVGWLQRERFGGLPAAPPDFELQRITAGSDGQGRFAAVEGVEHLRVSAAHHLATEIPIRAVPAGPDGLVVRLRQWPGGDYEPQSPREPSGAEILVRDAGSLAPVAGLALQLESFEPPVRRFSARTGADGVARVRCPPGEYGCLPAGPFTSHTFARIHVAAGAEQTRFLVRARRNPTVSFEIAELPADATVLCAVDGAQREVLVDEPMAVRGGLPMILIAQGGGSENVWRIDPVAADDAHRAFQRSWRPHTAERPAPVSRRPRVRAESAGTVLVDIRDPKGRFLSGRASVDGRWAGRGSRITFRRIPAGPHRVVVWAEGREVLVRPVTVLPGKTVRLLARLRPLE